MTRNGWHRLWGAVSGLWLVLVVVVGLPEALRTAGRVPTADVYARMEQPITVGAPIDFSRVMAKSGGGVAPETEEDRLKAVLVAAKVPEAVKVYAWDGYYAAKGGEELNAMLVRLRLPDEARLSVLYTAADYRGRAFRQRRTVGGDVLWFPYGLTESELAAVCDNYATAKRGILLRRGLEASAVLIGIAAGPSLLLYGLGWTFVWVRRRNQGGR